MHDFIESDFFISSLFFSAIMEKWMAVFLFIFLLFSMIFSTITNIDNTQNILFLYRINKN